MDSSTTHSRPFYYSLPPQGLSFLLGVRRISRKSFPFVSFVSTGSSPCLAVSISFLFLFLIDLRLSVDRTVYFFSSFLLFFILSSLAILPLEIPFDIPSSILYVREIVPARISSSLAAFLTTPDDACKSREQREICVLKICDYFQIPQESIV